MDAKQIAEKLRALRGSRTQEEIAAELGLSQSAVAMYENGARIPKDEIKERIAKFYKVSVGEIFFEL